MGVRLLKTEPPSCGQGGGRGFKKFDCRTGGETKERGGGQLGKKGG